MPPRSFRRTLFLAILGVALIPAGLALFGGVGVIREFGSSTGTLGPWDTVAESGRDLIELVRDPAADPAALEAAADAHEERLSESLRRSRLYALVTDRIGARLPVVAGASLLLLMVLAALVARSVSKKLDAPVQELVDWSGRIARGEPLPESATAVSKVREFRKLRRAMHGMERELREARDREMEAARARAWSEMARRVAHELKNPLTPIRMSASALARSGDPATRQTAEIILEESARLDEMARTFSQLGRLPEGPRAPIDLQELLAGVARGVEGEVEVRCAEDLPHPAGHHEPLGRALRNLVVNALEAVAEADGAPGSGAAATVFVSADRVGDAIEIRVEDSGPGIPEDLLERIWQPDVTTRSRGTGLGLALVRQTVHAHDGTVHAENRTQGGARFVIRLPVGADADGASGAGADAASDPGEVDPGADPTTTDAPRESMP